MTKEDRGGKLVPHAAWGQDHVEVHRVGSNTLISNKMRIPYLYIVLKTK